MTTQTKNWYARPAGGGQGLVIDGETGRNVAVCYDAADAELLAAAPEMARLLAAMLECHKPCTVLWNEAETLLGSLP